MEPRLENELLPVKPKRTITPIIKDCFIELIQAGITPSYAARELNVNIHTLRRYRSSDPIFKARWDEARLDLIDELEEALIERSIKGTQRPIVQKGERVYERNPETGELLLDHKGNPLPVVEHVYPDNVALSMLKAHKRQVYGDKVQHDVTVNTGVLRVPQIANDSDTWERLAEQPVIDVEAEHTSDNDN